jgi:DNA-binding NarL/FixJ family response regulator
MHLLLADDHALFRDGLSLLLKQLDPDVHIIEASCFEAAMASVESGIDLDLALLDLHMPGMNGVEGITRFQAQASDVPVVVISASEEVADIKDILDAGAMGYIPKSSSSQVMLSALRLVLAGGVYVPVNVLHDVDASCEPTCKSTASKPGAGSNLTHRQLEVLRLIIQGKPNKTIARELKLSEGTVKVHLASIYRALNASNRTEAAMAAQHLGLLSD